MVAACSYGLISPEVCAVSEPPPPPVVTPESMLADHLMRRWAPTYVQRVDADDRGRDRPTRIDFDGDWDASNNWDHQARFGTELPPAAYGAAILTATHAYLTYTLYYPRDWSRRFCVPLICHDNDLETVLVVVEREVGGAGRLVAVRTKAHHQTSDTPADQIQRTRDERPLLHVEPEGHGVAVCRRGDPRCAAAPGRIVYTYGEVASSPPAKALGQTVAYELVSLRDTLWARRSLANCGLWAWGETGPLHYQGREGRLGWRMGASLAGRRYIGGVRPPWAIKGARGARGDWFLDPAGPGERYVYNPFLDDLRDECVGAACAPAPSEPSRLRRWTSLGANGLAAWIDMVL